MTIELIIALVFGLGIVWQASLSVGMHLEGKKGGIRRYIGIISLSIFVMLELIAYIYGKILPHGNPYAIFPVYIFYYFACPVIVYLNRSKALTRINEIKLMIVNVIFIYYGIILFGPTNIITILIYIVVAKCIWLMTKKELNDSDERALYTWYSLLFLVLGIINIFKISIGNSSNILWLALLGCFAMGGAYYYIFAHLVPIIYLNSSDGSYSDIMEKRDIILKAGGLFEKTNLNIFLVIAGSVALLLAMLINYKHDYVPETLVVPLLLLCAAMVGLKRKPNITKVDHV